MTQFKREKQSTFDEQKKRMRDQIVREIRDVINAKARAGNFTLVLDSSADSLSYAPVILFTTPQFDLTDDVLKQMNIGAPPGSLDDDSSKAPRGDIKLNIPEQDKEKPAKKK